MPSFTTPSEGPEKLILRDILALERTKLANERTFFAYLRTALYLLTAGIGILEIKSIEHLAILAYLCLTLGGILFLTGVFRYRRLNRDLKTHLSTKSEFPRRTFSET